MMCNSTGSPSHSIGGEREASIILDMIVNHYITIRGFCIRIGGKAQEEAKEESAEVQRIKEEMVCDESDKKE